MLIECSPSIIELVINLISHLVAVSDAVASEPIKARLVSIARLRLCTLSRLTTAVCLHRPRPAAAGEIGRMRPEWGTHYYGSMHRVSRATVKCATKDRLG